MAKKVAFGEVPKKLKKGLFLFPPRPGDFNTVRFLGEQVCIYQSWDGAARKFNCFHNKVENSIGRIASFVIDRKDDKIKAFICPLNVFKQMGEYGQNHDFKIRREGAGIRTKYFVESLGETSVSEEIENKIIFTQKAYPIEDIFVYDLKWEILEEEIEVEQINNRFDLLDL